MRSIAAFIFIIFALPSWAACVGQDLLTAMAPEARASLEDKAHAQPYPEGILWQATRGDQVIHLVGTMHFHEPRHDQTFAQAKPWIDAAQTIFLELGDGDEQRLQTHITANPGLAFIVDGPTLPDLLSPDDWARLSKAMTDRGTPAFFAAKMKPWMALMTLSLTKCVVEDMAAGKRGLDQRILDYAGQIGNPGQALEPFDTAFKIFEGYGQDEMLRFLSLYLRLENADPNDQNYTMIEAYFREEIRVIWELSLAQSLAEPQGMSEDEILAEFARLEEALITRRNIDWMDKILPAADQGPVFIAVGALHLPGEFGVLNLLEEEGFQITRIARE